MKTTFPQNTSTLESTKPADGGSRVAQDMRNALSAIFQGDLSPLRARAQGTPNMTLKVNASLVEGFFNQFFRNLIPIAFAGGNSTTVIAPTSNPRIDILTLNSGGSLAWVIGAENVSPVALWSGVPGDSIPICLIYCKTTMDRILNYEDKDSDSTEGYIYQDVRPFFAMGASKFTQLTDAPASYSGQGTKQVRVRQDETGLEFIKGVTGAEIDVLRDNLAILAFRQAVQGSLSVQKFEDGVMDDYQDQSGIDTGNSINQSYDATGKLYTPARLGGGLDANAKLALLMNGTGASFVDSATPAKTVTPNGNATQLPYKFNKSAGFFGGTSKLIIPDHADWDFSGDLTIEAFVMFTTLDTYWFFSRNNNADMSFYYSAGIMYMSIGNVDVMQRSWSPTAFTWYHVALVRTSGVFKMFVNGTQLGADYSNSTSFSYTNPVYVGGSITYDQAGRGWLKEYRISSVARYTGNFTPTTSQFSSDANTKALLHFDTPATAPLAPCLALDGSGDYLTLAGSSDFTLGPTGSGNDWTIEGWFRHADTATDGLITTYNGSNGWQIYFESAGPYIAIYANGTSRTSPTFNMIANRWYHIAIVKSGTTITLYVDGISLGNFSGDANMDSQGNTLAVGCNQNNGNDAWNGWIKELRISKGIARYTANFTPSQTPFTADSQTKLLLHFSENNGVTTFIDSETTPKTVTTNGNAVIKYEEDYRNTIFKDDGNTGHKPYSPPAKNGKIDFVAVFGGSSCYLDGSGDYLSLADHADWDFGTGDWTIEGWARWIGSPASTTLVMVGTNSNGVNFAIYDTGGVAGFHVYVVGTEYYSSHAYTPLQDTWYHFLASRSGNNLRFFINGTQNGNTEDITGKNITGLTEGVRIGSNSSGTGQLNGLCENIRISNVARYTAVFNPPSSEFDLGTVQNMTLISQAQTAQAAPSAARVILLQEDVDAITPNTDLKAWASRDGTNYDQITLVNEGNYDASKKILAGNIDPFVAASGVSMKYKLTTHNAKDLKVHAAGLTWK